MSAAVWGIFTKIAVPVAIDSPPRAVTSFLGYNKIQDGGWVSKKTPKWKLGEINLTRKIQDGRHCHWKYQYPTIYWQKYSM